MVGLPLLRLRGHYLAFGTLAFQLITLSVIGEARDLTGGDTGLTAIPPLGIGPLVVEGPFKPIVFAYLAWGLALLTLLFNQHLVRSRPGPSAARAGHQRGRRAGRGRARRPLQAAGLCAVGGATPVWPVACTRSSSATSRPGRSRWCARSSS